MSCVEAQIKTCTQCKADKPFSAFHAHLRIVSASENLKKGALHVDP